MNDASREYLAQIEQLEANQRWDQAADGWQRWLAVYPNSSAHAYANRAHKRYIHALCEAGSFDAAFAAYQLVRRDDAALTVADTDILCCCTVRNERQRLPFFLDYYRQLGVTKFFMIDNGSTDDALTFLLTQPDVYTWHSNYPFSKANFGAAWFELLLQRYGIGHWVLLVDVDELLYYPDCEVRNLPTFCAELESCEAKAYRAILLDMYADKPLAETCYQAGQDFRDLCPFFDRQFYHVKVPMGEQIKNQTGYWGGVRRRVFGGTQGEYCLNKVPLIQYAADCLLTGGQHGTSYPLAQIAPGMGVLLHFKFFASFLDYTASEIQRKEHATQAIEYRNYAYKLARRPSLTLYDASQSVRLRDSNQLIALGIMQLGPQENLDHVHEAWEVRHKQINVYIKLGETWLVKGEVRRAIALYRKIIELDATFAPAYLRVIYILQEHGFVDEALSYLRIALALFPDEPMLQIIAHSLQDIDQTKDVPPFPELVERGEHL